MILKPMNVMIIEDTLVAHPGFELPLHGSGLLDLHNLRLSSDARFFSLAY